MSAVAARRWPVAACVLLLLAGCAPLRPIDYRAFREHPPRSILILPPLGDDEALEGGYRYLATLSRPVAERGYYVFRVAVVDQLLKQSGLATPAEMHAATRLRLLELTGADAVLYPQLHAERRHDHGSSRDATVRVSARLIDLHTGTELWSGDGASAAGTESGGLLGDSIAALLLAPLGATADPVDRVGQLANAQLFTTRSRELPIGPYHPDFAARR